MFPSNEFADVDSGSLDVMTTAGGQFLNTFFTAAYVAGALGSAITSQASVARILFAMGRDGILPRRVFGHVSARFGTPDVRDPGGLRDLAAGLVIDLAMLASIVSFGALVAFSAVNLTVIKHYFVDEGEKNVFNNIVLPVIGFLLTVCLWFSLSGARRCGRVDLVGRRIHMVARRDPRLPAPDAGARHAGVTAEHQAPEHNSQVTNLLAAC